mmetsp:Transcript_11388/g.34329  ORF Transcript_11388/g.34329 Transcript_11388/m.34329 type:complete len:530 (-) Transcript_11388:60-1649(-)
MPALSKAARPAQVLLLRQPALRVARRSLGDSVSGPPVQDLAENWKRACQFFTKDPSSYAEFKQQCVSLRIFVFAGVTGGCALALFADPPKSSYWQRWSPMYWFSHLKAAFSSDAPPLFLTEKADHSAKALAVISSVTGVPATAKAAKAKAAAAAEEPAGSAPPAPEAAATPEAPVEAAATEPKPAEPAAAEPPAAEAPAVTPEATPSAAWADLERRVAELEVHRARECHSAFVFIKPHAVCDRVKELVKAKLAAANITVLDEGSIPAEDIDSKQLIDTHYGAIAAKAVKQKPDSLVVSAKAQEEFKKAFGMDWTDALKQGRVFNAMDGAAKLGISTSDMGAKFGTLQKGTTLLKFGGGFYCGQVDDIFVINGFYMDMRSKFTTPGTSIHYYTVEWSPRDLAWADFRTKVLGTTDPAAAEPGSMRRLIYSDWQSLGLQAQPDTGDNGVHASASPFEALAERNNWLGVPLAQDRFGRAMLSAGVPRETVQAWCEDPPVSFEGKKQSLFDLLEDLDSGACLKKASAISGASP